MKKQPNDPAAPGRFAYEGLDRVLHEKARLGILVSLSARPDGVIFGELKELCALTDGNLNRHLEVLDEAGLIEIHKSFVGKRPQTRVRLTARGRKRFFDYVAELERVVRDTQAAASASASRAGWAPV
jgi:DNA-binding MarR family transcriptional regulator